MRELLHEELSGVVRQTAFEVHCYFRNGFAEKVYENALANRLRRKGLIVDQRLALTVRDEDGTVVGDYEADLVVNKCLLLEIKAARALVNDHTAQTINYLRITGVDLGMLINFGREKLEIKRVVFDTARPH